MNSDNNKRKISISQEDINDQVQASHGYMTRNKMKKKQPSNNDDVRANVSLEASFKEDKSKMHPSKTIKNIKKRPTITFKKKVKLSYDDVFGTNVSLIKTSFKKGKSKIQPTNNKKIKKPTITYRSKSKLDFTFDHSSLVEKHKNTQHKKIPLLFESDSESEMDYLYSIDKINEMTTSSPEMEDIRPVFNRNAKIKTYFNKKSNIFNRPLNMTYTTISNYIEQNNINENPVTVIKEIGRQFDEELMGINLQDNIENQLISEKSNSIEKNVIHGKKSNICHDKINPNINTTNHMTYQNDCDPTKRKENRISEIPTNATKNYDSFKNENFNFKSNNLESLRLDSKCCCRVLFHLNEDANKILTSKTKHFVFDDNKTICKLFVQQKQLEANMLEQIIAEDSKSNIQSERRIPNLNLKFLNQTQTKLIDEIKNNHFEPKILEILKDVYVGVEFLSEFIDSNPDDDELENINSNVKINVDTLIPKNNVSFVKVGNQSPANATTSKNPIHKPNSSMNNNSSIFDIFDHDIKSSNRSDYISDIVNANSYIIKPNSSIPKKQIDSPNSFKESKVYVNCIKNNGNINKSNAKSTKISIHKSNLSMNDNFHFNSIKHDHDNLSLNLKTAKPTENFFKKENYNSDGSNVKLLKELNVNSKTNGKNIVSLDDFSKLQNSRLFDLPNNDDIKNNTIDDDVFTLNVKTNKLINEFNIFNKDNDNLDGLTVSEEPIVNPETCEDNFAFSNDNINTVTRSARIKTNVDHINFNGDKNYTIPKQQYSRLFDISDNDGIEMNRSSEVIDTIDDDIFTLNVKTIKPTDNFNLFKERNDNFDGYIISENTIVNPKIFEENFVISEKNIDTDIKANLDHIQFNEYNDYGFSNQRKSKLFDLPDNDDIKNDISDFMKGTIDDDSFTLNVQSIKLTDKVNIFKEENDNLESYSASEEPIINPKTCKENFVISNENINTVIRSSDTKTNVDHINFNENKNYALPPQQSSRLFDVFESNTSSDLIKVIDTNDDQIFTMNVKTIKHTDKVNIFKQENDNSDGFISNVIVSEEPIVNFKTYDENFAISEEFNNTVTKSTDIKTNINHINFNEYKNYDFSKQQNSRLFDLPDNDDIKINISDLIKGTIDDDVFTSNVKSIKPTSIFKEEKDNSNAIPKQQKPRTFDLLDNIGIEDNISSDFIKDTIDDVFTSNVKTIKPTNTFKEENDNLDGYITSNMNGSEEPIDYHKTCENNFNFSDKIINTVTRITDIKNTNEDHINFNVKTNYESHYDTQLQQNTFSSKPIELLDNNNKNNIDTIPKQLNSNLFYLSDHENIESDGSSDDDCYKLLIDDDNELKNNEITNIQIKNDLKNQLMSVNSSDTIVKIKNAIQSVFPKNVPVLPASVDSKPVKACTLKKDNNILLDYNSFMTIEQCNELYKKTSLMKKGISFNENQHFSKTIQDIFSEMYVDTIFVSNCQHMVELCDSNIMLKEDFNQPSLSNIQPITETERNNQCQQNHKLENSISTLQKLNSSQEQKGKSNIQIRVKLRELIKSNQPINEILKSTEFKNLSSFCEKEIASTIGVLLFESTLNAPTITGLTAFGVNCEEMNNEEINKLLRSTNLNISCPKIMKLTSITLELVKTFKSDKLINLVLNIIRNNIFSKRINLNNKNDHHLIIQTLYLVDICDRLGMLKYLQTFIWDSIVLLPNKYCCVIFMSLMICKNCLPVKANNEQDPVIIFAISYLIAKRKSYINETVNHNIYQQELINLLSFKYNYSFTVDLPFNFIQHRHKPDFFPSVMMVLKCSYAKDMVEFTFHCLFPIIEQYLNTQQDERYAIQTMESIFHSFRLFRFSFRPTVVGYLNSRKSTVNNYQDKTFIYMSMYQGYRTMLNKMIEYINDSRPRSQYFEELLVSIIMLLGCVDYCTSCAVIMKWKPKFKPSTFLTKKYDIFQSILGHTLWNRLCAIDDINTIICLISMCTLGDEVYNTLEKLR